MFLSYSSIIHTIWWDCLSRMQNFCRPLRGETVFTWSYSKVLAHYRYPRMHELASWRLLFCAALPDHKTTDFQFLSFSELVGLSSNFCNPQGGFKAFLSSCWVNRSNTRMNESESKGIFIIRLFGPKKRWPKIDVNCVLIFRICEFYAW